MTATTPPPLPADLNEGLRRLKMAAMRRLAPELLVTAKTQRWNPEEFLRTLVLGSDRPARYTLGPHKLPIETLQYKLRTEGMILKISEMGPYNDYKVEREKGDH